MGLIHSRFQKDGAFFWDNRAASLEIQTLIPFQSPVEMGMRMDTLLARIAAKPFYPTLFQSAFGTTAVTSDRVAKALAQFIRSMNSFGSKFRQGVNSATGNPSIVPFSNFTAQENLGKDLFMDIFRGNCQACHTRNIMVQQGSHNIGLDLVYADNGVGAATGNANKNGEFSVPSLINIDLTPPYMHDGRYQTLEQVIDFYSDSVRNHPNLSGFLKAIQPGNTDPNHVFCDTCQPRRLNYTPAEKSALVAFLKTFTDTTITTDVRWSNPFCCGTHNVRQINTCNNYEWFGQNYSASGRYVHEYVNSNGCVSADTLYLTINQGTFTSSVQTACGSYTWRGTTYTSSGRYIYNYTNSGGCPSADTLHLTINGCQNSVVNVRAFLQGAFQAPGSLNASLLNAGISTDPGLADSITVEIRSGINGSLIGSPIKTVIRTTGRIRARFPYITGSHYIVLKHRNSIETWSANPVLFSDTVDYDFTTSADKAFGNNQVQVGPNSFALWSGDLNRDGMIESSDYLLMENNILSIIFGYHTSDLNGDASVESSDYLLIENNIPRIIFTARPF